MTNAKPLRSRLAAAALFSASLLAPASVALAKPAAVGLGGPRIEVTQRDVDRSNEKVAMAYSALVDMWTKDFRNIGERFVPPRIVRYTGAARTTSRLHRTEQCASTVRTTTLFSTTKSSSRAWQKPRRTRWEPMATWRRSA
mgnify:CR=1 FL=1